MLTGLLLVGFATWLNLAFASEPAPLPCYVYETVNSKSVGRPVDCESIYGE